MPKELAKESLAKFGMCAPYVESLQGWVEKIGNKDSGRGKTSSSGPGNLQKNPSPVKLVVLAD